MFNDLKFDIFTRFIDVGEIFYHHRLITISFLNIKSQIIMGCASSSPDTGTEYANIPQTKPSQSNGATSQEESKSKENQDGSTTEEVSTIYIYMYLI
jgi:hypothetical protein